MPSKLLELQGLRGLACLMVVLYHTPLADNARLTHNPFSWFHRFGFAGVDLFFVLSGFVITYAHYPRLGDRAECLPYLAKRARRIYPAYWICFLATTVLFHWVAERCYFPGYFRQCAYHLILVPTGSVNFVLPHAWSLYFELLFYAVFAFLFLLPRRYARYFLGAWIAAAVAGTVCVGHDPVWHWWMPISGFSLEFLMGCIAAWAVRRGRIRHERPAFRLGVGGAVAGIAWAIAAFPHVPSHGLRAVLFGFPYSLLVYALIVRESKGLKGLPRWLRPVGEASYSIYLIHFPLFAAFGSLGWSLAATDGIRSPALGLAFAFAALVSGFLYYRAVERPLLARRKSRAPDGIVRRRAA